jgi:uncharacterized membrane protein YgdD (TMEM256/DUF423 family)
MSSQKRILILGGIFGGLAVAIGAFGAHALKNILLEHGRQETYELAVKYQFYHALALLIMGSVFEKLDRMRLKWAAYFIAGGTTIFSGSLYTLSLSGNTSWGAITPIGGVLLIVGWLFFIFSAVK